jgi:16S rRNA (cytosine1402-N4)-methyltransferase
MQLDEPERGFSFRFDGPLDMRMGGEGPSATDVVNSATVRDLARIIGALGEEHHAGAVARAIVKARAEQPITTTSALADVIAKVVRIRPGEIHPATRTFQGLRIFVNDELGELATALVAAERMLKAGGRLVVISFHSLEDRIVKTFLVDHGRAASGSRHQPEIAHVPPSFTVLTRKPVVADDDEISSNPRSRSAKLRAAERTEAAAINDDLSHLLPRMPALSDVMKGR